MKGNSTCPMCRRNICFRGFTHSVNKWRREKEEQKLQQVFADAVDHILLDDPESEWSEEEPEEEPTVEPIVRESSPDASWEEESEWTDDESEYDIDMMITEINYYINPPNKIDLLIEMEKKFNNFKDEYDCDDLLEIIVHPYYTVQKTRDHFLYENKPDVSDLFSRYTPQKLTGMSQKRRRQVQTPGSSVSLIHLLLGQLVLIV
jgi:hypothetical protein